MSEPSNQTAERGTACDDKTPTGSLLDMLDQQHCAGPVVSVMVMAFEVVQERARVAGIRGDQRVMDRRREDDARRTAAHNVEPTPDITAEESPERPMIRVSKPVPPPSDGELDALQHAIRAVKREPPMAASAPSVSTGRLARIDQASCGEITGSITGQVFCYGCAIHEGIAVYINLAGPRMAVEAIRAKLSKGEHVTVVPPDAPSVELTAGEGNTGVYLAYLHYLPEARFASLILVHEWAVAPNYGGKATTFMFRTNDAQAASKLAHHVTQLVNLPVFEAWSAYLYDAGQHAMMVRTTRSAGGIDLLTVDLDVDAWTRLITGGLAQGSICLPESRI